MKKITKTAGTRRRLPKQLHADLNACLERTISLECQAESAEQSAASLARYRHPVPTACFLGLFQDYDLYYQDGQLVARFSDEPDDFLLGVCQRQGAKVPALAEAGRRAEEQGLELDLRHEPEALRLTTTQLLRHVTAQGASVACFRYERTYRRDHSVQAASGRIVELGTQPALWETTPEEFLQQYPDHLGAIWHIELDTDPDGDDD